MTSARRRLCSSTFAAALVVSLAAVIAGGPGPAAAKPKTYVALGDSYASGPLIPMQEEPYGCLRSTNDYAKLLARRLGLELRDVSCSGATTKDMTRAQGVTPGPNPPQFDALDTRTGLVTVQIGGNDIGFGGIAQTCGRAAVEQRSCRSVYVDEATGRDELRERIAATAPKVAAVVQGIRARAPRADVLVLGYPAIFRVGPGPASCPAMGVGEDDALYLRGVEEALNGMIEQAAVANGAEYVDVYGPSAGRTACDLPVLRWVEPLVPVNAAAPIHPNLNGMAGISDVVEAAIRRRAGSTDLELPVDLPASPPITSPF